jgi:integrase/recombinase XerD
VTQFLSWCETHGITLAKLEPVMIAAYIKQHPGSIPTRKQHLAAIRSLFDYLVTGQVLPFNPAASVRGQTYSIEKGKTPVLSAQDARVLLDSIATHDPITGLPDITGLRDRALIGLMVYSFARVSAAANMKVKDYYPNGKRYWIRLHEKGGKDHEVPAHHNTEKYLDAYLEAAGIAEEKNTPLFRSIKGNNGKMTKNGLDRRDVYAMIRRRAGKAGINAAVCCHTFRATGITVYLQNGGALEHAQAIAAHKSTRTTKLYDRRNDAISLDEIERILI